MTPLSEREHEVAQILLAAVSGEASQEDLEKLAGMVAEDRALLSFVVDFMNQESWLIWHRIKCSTGDSWEDLQDEITRLAQSTNMLVRSDTDPDESSKAKTDDVVQQENKKTAFVPIPFPIGLLLRESRIYFAIAAVLLLSVGMFLGLALSEWQASDRYIPPEVARNDKLSDEGLAADYAVRYVRGTACFWNQAEGRNLYTDHQFRLGEALNLLQGIAELHFDLPDGFASLQIEGPAGLVLTESHGASLSHGKFTVDVHSKLESLPLDTPAGAIEVPGSTSLGVQIFGGNVEVHVFHGSAQIIVPWTAGPEESKLLEIQEGTSVALVSSVDGRIQIERGVASLANFAAKMSMSSDQLLLPERYESEILKASPLLYWRFEQFDAERVADVSGNGNEGRLIGRADWTKLETNSSLVLGERVSEEAIETRVVSETPISADFEDGYTVEVWFKPSHYHWGSMIGMLVRDPNSGELAKHGLALELGGARSTNSDIERPGRIRFLHRTPPTADVSVGTSCFSESAYVLREWQHLVAVKDAEHLRLYVNGQLTCQEQDNTTLTNGMHLILGQLDEQQFYRRFVGQIDELALYPRPLTEEEITSHYELVRPQLKPESNRPDRNAPSSSEGLRQVL